MKLVYCEAYNSKTLARKREINLKKIVPQRRNYIPGFLKVKLGSQPEADQPLVGILR